MSEVIVRMEMPKSCPCDLIGVGYDMYCSAANGIPKRVAEYDECVKNGTRPAWCPIIGELPEQHGDLIDRAWLLKFFDGINDIIDEDDVKCAQTIVPATERSET